MRHSASTIAAELMRQIADQLPSRPLFGGFHHFVIKVSMPAEADQAARFDALGLLLEQLEIECPEWGIDVCGGPLELEVKFTR